MFSQVGLPELLIVLVIVLLIFGPKRLPGLGRQLGSGLREFKDSVTGGKDDDEQDTPSEAPRAELSEPPAPPDAQSAPAPAEAPAEPRG